jgi:hypothetical protein
VEKSEARNVTLIDRDGLKKMIDEANVLLKKEW